VEKEPSPRRVGQLKLALAAVGVLVIAVAAFVAYRKFFAAPPPPPPKPAVTVRPAPPPQKVEPPAPSPAAQKTPAVAGAPVKSVAPPAAPTPKAPGISTTPAAKAPGAPAVAEVRPTPPAPPAEPKASLQFRAFVDRLKIGGVRGGPPARIFIGGITYQQGDVINQDLGVVFVGVDPTTEELLFKDGSGVVVRRHL
jgi:hypothetical protein